MLHSETFSDKLSQDPGLPEGSDERREAILEHPKRRSCLARRSRSSLKTIVIMMRI